MGPALPVAGLNKSIDMSLLQSEPVDVGNVVTIGCRKSDLALIQARLIISTLNQRLQQPPIFEIKTHTVVGDADKHTPFVQLAKRTGGSDVGKSLWTTGLESDLMSGRSDFLVHCLKDMPTTLPPNLVLAAIPEREDPSDAVVMRAGSEYKSMDELPPGSVVGTSSSRRKALVKRNWPHLDVVECRGNVYVLIRLPDIPD
jgi:hydroxymethylbilane synthase